VTFEAPAARERARRERQVAGELAALLAGAARATPDDAATPDTPPAEAALAPILAAAAALLAPHLDHAVVPVLASARRDLMVVLARRLTRVCLRVLAREQQVIDALAAVGSPSQLDGSAAAWGDRFQEYPVLADLVAQTTLDFREFVVEMLSRLADDRELLGRQIFGGRPLAALARVRGDAGDVHARGRSVAVLRFEDGSGVVYKPKDLRVTRAVIDLCRFFNAAGLPLALHVREVLPRTGYTWEELVPAAPCCDADEVRRFHVRMGMLVRLLELLEGRDFWLDNVIAAGEHPILIDLEMVLQPRRRAAASATDAERAADEQLRESAANLGVLSAPVAIAAGLAAEDLGALTPSRELRLPVAAVPAHEALTGAPRPSRDGYILWTPVDHAPVLDGASARAVDHVEALVEGYRAMQAAIFARREELLSASGPLAALAGLPVRVVHTSTWRSIRALHAGLDPDLLTDVARREAYFAAVLGASGLPEDRRGVLRAEIAALSDLAIPYFLCRTDGDALLDGEGRTLVEGFFTGSALSRVTQRVQEARALPAAGREDLVRSTLATSHDAGASRHVATIEDGPAVDWLTEAVAVGDQILGAAVRAGGGLSWIGLTYDPAHDLRWIDVLKPDIVTGSTGLSIVLADLFVASGHERFRDAALGAIAATRAAAAEARVDVGALRGAGAHLYALHRCGVALRAAELTDAATELARALVSVSVRATLDLATGVAGLVLAAVACDAESLARAIVTQLEPRLADADLARSPYPSGALLARRLPDLQGGISLTAARLASRFGIALRYEPDRGAAPTSSGAHLARLATFAAAGGDRERLAAGVAGFLASDLRAPGADRLERLDVALTAARTLASPELGRAATRLGRAMVAERRAEGRWFPDRSAASCHDLSALWGLGAVAHALLRLHEPGRFRAIVTID
jgi:type 2 lantibiotic biosynthesis protein LanM